MKRIGAFSLAIFIFVLSVFSVIPVDVYADDDKIVIPTVNGHFGLTESDAQSKVSAHKDIYYDNDMRAFAYTPASSYNWTLCNDKGAVTSTHLSDKQVVALLCSSNKFVNNRTLFTSFLSNNNIFRGFMSGVGALFTGDSDNGTKFLDTLTGNYNYLDALSYDEDSQTITMSNDNGSVDKLREEIKNYYYISNGMFYLSSVGELSSAISTSNYSDMSLYQEDFNIAMNYDYIFKQSSDLMVAFKSSDISYFYYTNAGTSYDDSYKSVNPIQFVDTKLNSVSVDTYAYSGFNFNDGKDYSFHELYLTYTGYNQRYNIFDSIKRKPYWDIFGFGVKDNETEKLRGISGYYNHASLYSKDKKNLLGFISYEALYNYVHGDQNAYLSSKIDETGKDISYSIKDMNENLGDKMDQLIDSINSGKGSMTSDELQNAIDKGLEELNKNTEDIKDNTSSILDKLEEQNQILLQILGVTEYIAYQTTKDDGSSYTKTDLTNTINKIYNGLGNAILYGKNTLTDSGDSSGAASQSSIVTREDFKLSNNIYTSSGSGVSPGTPVVAYSLDDCSVYDDSNDYDVGIATHDINNMDIHDGLFGKFPFSVPYQLYEWLQVLQADPVAPKLVYNYGFLIGHKGEQKYDLTIDLSVYESWAYVCKSFLRLSFTLAMSLFLYKKFKGNSIF